MNLSAIHRWRMALLSAAALSGMEAVHAQAREVIDGGATVTVPGDRASPWDIDCGNCLPALIVGDTGTGTLTIIANGTDPAGVVSNTHAHVAESAGSVGTVTVTGSGAKWANTRSLTIGYRGEGTLNILDGGWVDYTGGAQALVGMFATSTGAVNVDGAGSRWTLDKDTAIGNGSGGIGTLRITRGGQVAVTNGGVDINGPLPSGGEPSVIVVDGEGSSLHSALSIDVGGSLPDGHGRLRITGGGAVVSDTSFINIARSAGSVGDVVVSGLGSTMTPATDVYVGARGKATLTIEQGGVVTSQSGGIGIGLAGSGGTAWVDGAGSLWDTGDLTIGSLSDGTLILSNGGKVMAKNSVEVAYAEGVTGAIHIGAATGQTAAPPGVLDTPVIWFGNETASGGTGAIHFNHSATLADNYQFAAQITDTGAVTHTAGDTTLTSGSNDYSGPTRVEGGTLRAGAAGALSPNSAVTVLGDATLDMGGHPQTIASLNPAGTGGGTLKMTLNAATATASVLTIGAGGNVGGVTVLDIAATGTAPASSPAILLVNASSAASVPADAFTLTGGGDTLTLDDRIYTLKQGDGAANPHNWYLLMTATSLPAGAAAPIPTLGYAILALLALLMMGGAVWLRRRNS
jgi:T5SS/PEP-CTERM-associated repeat protein/autotransporter-associated beta strand protein